MACSVPATCRTDVVMDQNACRPVVATADDANNFDDYSALGAMHHDTLLSRAEQQQFTGF